jgi:hypothetical protein
MLLSVAGAIAVSPLAPVGPVRLYDPARGVEADWLVLGGGGALLLVMLLIELGWLAWRAVRQSRALPAARSSALVAAASRAALPVTLVTGIRHALERGTGRLRAPVLATLTGSVVAVAALVAALVFGASLTGLTSHPARYGYTWDTLVQSSGGWGSWPTGSLDPTAKWIGNRHTGLLGWSELGFGQVSIGGTEIPVMGILSHGSRVVEPPTTSGHPLTGQDQIEFGTVSMRQLGLHLGERIRIGPVSLTVVGTATLPSFGVVLTDHPSLGRGAMTEEATLLRILHFPVNPTPKEIENAVSTPAYPATVVFDASTRADASAIAATFIRNASNAPGEGNEGDFYTEAPQLGAAVINASQMGSQPVALAVGVATAAVLALALTILASVRERRRDLALLKALGLRARQIRAVVGWQTSTILVIAIAAGVPLGIAGGSWAWTLFASSIGVVPLPEVPQTTLVLGIAALLVAGNLLALWPAHVAARIAPAATFRTE